MKVDPGQVKSIFLSAVDHPTDQRDRYLDQACQGNRPLRQRVEALLAAHQEEDRLFDEPDVALVITGGLPDLKECAGSVIDRYKLLEKIGEGGMAVVYMAEQERPIRRKVALKIIKVGMDTKQVIARFEAERQALALMDHPHIAKVLDAGTTDTGRPYFVMELVKGVSITEYCDQYELSVDARLALFSQVCHAVQHAHQKGIIHRDIKPSNVMVAQQDAVAVPKIIDFGIVKAINQRLTEKTLFTQYAQIIGTPTYMSPEQAEFNNLDVDTRTDIYSLGILLYELLTGTLPFSEEQLRQAGCLEMQRVIREDEPPKPSTKLSTMGAALTDIAKQRHATPEFLRKTVRGDLDWIVMKTLEKERSRRYETASELAMDIKRHLDDEPVLAHAPGPICRLQKFLRRHRTKVVGVLALLVLLGAAIVILSMRKENQHQQADYQRQQEELESSKDSKILSDSREAAAMGNLDTALRMVGSILDSPHVRSKARLLHTRLWLNLKLFDTAKKHDFTDTIVALESLLQERDEIAGQAHLLLAKLYYDSYPKAIEMKEEYRSNWEYHRQKAERLLPGDADTFLHKAQSAGTVHQAFDWINRALALTHDTHYDSLRERAYLHYVSHDYFNMLLDAIKLTGIQPKHALGYSLSAIAQRELEWSAGALKNHNRAIKLAPAEPEYYDQRRRTCLQMGRYEEALGDTRECIALEPGKSVYHYNEFCALTALGRYEEAQAQHEKIMTSGIPKWHLGVSAAKHVSDCLVAGRPWHPEGNPPEGPAFERMLKAEELHHQWTAKRAQRVVSQGFNSNWSPDGNELAYSRGVLGSTGIAIWNRQTGKTRLLTVPGSEPVWSPDGQTIAYVRDRRVLFVQGIPVAHLDQRGNEELQEIWLAPVDGKEDPTFLAKGRWPQWSKSNRIFFRPPRSFGKLYSMSPDGTDAKTLMLCPSDFAPAISPDERYAACQQLGCVLIRDMSSGELVGEWVGPIGVQVHFLSWSPKEQKLGICVSGGGSASGGLWIYDMSRKTATKVLRGDCRSSSWSQTEGGQIAVTRSYGFLHHEIWTAATADLEPGQTMEEHTQEAIQYYTERIKTEPDNAENHVKRAAYYIHLNDAEKAFTDLDRYEDLVESTNKTKAATYYDLGWRLSHMPQQRVDPNIVVKLHRRAHKLSPTDPWVQGTLGIAYCRARKWQEAINTIKTIAKGKGYYAFFPAMAHWQLGDRDQAQTWFKRGIASMHRNAATPGGSYMTPRCGYYMEAAELMDLKIKHFDRKAPATGTQIQPVTIRTHSSHLSEAVLRCVDGTGLDDGDKDSLLEHSEDPNHMWISQKGQTQGWLEFDLGNVHDLGSMLVWNYNERNHTSRGIESVDISIWTEENGWQQIHDDIVFTEAEGSFDYDEPDYIQLNGVKAQKVRLEDLKSLGDETYIGLSEVQFFQKRDEDPQSTVKTIRAEKKHAIAGFVFGEPVNLGPTVNSEARDWAPSLSADGLELYFHSDRLGGYGSNNIWVTKRETADSEWWSTPKNLGPTVNSLGAGMPNISADGLELYFGSPRPGGSGSADLWMTTRKTKEHDWETPVNLGSTINSSSADSYPCISSNGLELYFTSNRDDWKTWVTKRTTKDGLWGTPKSLGATIHKGGAVMDASLSADGLTLLFCSWRSGGHGNADIWVSRRATKDAPWSKPQNLGQPVNSRGEEREPTLSPDGSTLYFSSDRRGGLGNFDLWQVPVRPVADGLEE